MASSRATFIDITKICEIMFNSDVMIDTRDRKSLVAG
jgi:hypothetical protein